MTSERNNKDLSLNYTFNKLENLINNDIKLSKKLSEKKILWEIITFRSLFETHSKPLQWSLKVITLSFNMSY